MQTRLTRAFGLRHPIVSAPMGLISGGRLAAAVSAAGGLGLVGGGYAGLLGAEPDLHHELALVRGHTFGIGFITWALARNPGVLDEMLGYRPACVFLSFGDAGPFAAKVRAAGAQLICQVQCLRHVDEALDAGAAIIVAQGAMTWVSLGRYLLPAVGVYLVAGRWLAEPNRSPWTRDCVVAIGTIALTTLMILFAHGFWAI